MRPFEIRYAYNPENGEYTGEVKAYATPALFEQGIIEFDEPLNTTIAPPLSLEKANESCRWNPLLGQWELVPDFTKEKFWDVKTKEEITLEIGLSPGSGATSKQPPLGDCQYSSAMEEWLPRPELNDVLRPFTWDEQKMGWWQKEVPVQGFEIALEVEKLLIARAHQLVDKVNFCRIIAPYSRALNFESEVSKKSLMALLENLVFELNELDREELRFNAKSLLDELLELFGAKKFSS